MKPIHHKRTGLTAYFEPPYWKVICWGLENCFCTRKEALRFIRKQPSASDREDLAISASLMKAVESVLKAKETQFGLNSPANRKLTQHHDEVLRLLQEVLSRERYSRHTLLGHDEPVKRVEVLA